MPNDNKSVRTENSTVTTSESISTYRSVEFVESRPLWKKILCDVSVQIFTALIIGLLLGAFAPKFSVAAKPFSDIFLRMIQCLIVPLIFSTLTVGIAEHRQDLAAVGRQAVKSLLYFEIVTTIGLILALLMANISGVGKGINFSEDGNFEETPPNSITWQGEINNIVPESFFAAAAENSVLQIVFCSIIFAIALCRVTRQRDYYVIVAWLRAISNTMFAVTDIVMFYAPIGVCLSIAYAVGTHGLGVLKSLGLLVGIMYACFVGIIICVFVPVMLICKISVVQFFTEIGPSILLGFSTASSESTLPGALEALTKMGVSRKISGFVIPIGYSFNLTGSSIYLPIAALYCANAAGISLSISEQVIMLLTLMLTSKGMAAVPRAALVVLSATLGQFGVPTSTVSLILGADAFLDMGQTAINVAGNCLASIVIARWEHEFPPYGQWEGDYADKDPRTVEARERAEEETLLSTVKNSTLATYSVATML